VSACSDRRREFSDEADLIFIGSSPRVAVAPSPATSRSSFFRPPYPNGAAPIDPALALVLLSGGTSGHRRRRLPTFTLLRALGQIDLMIALSYVVLSVCPSAGLMYGEADARDLADTSGVPIPMSSSGSTAAIHGLPLKMRSSDSKIICR